MRFMAMGVPFVTMLVTVLVIMPMSSVIVLMFRHNSFP
jgi:hypothetical protein